MERKAPIIGVTPLWDAEKNSVWMLPGYMEGIQAAGGIPVILPLGADTPSARQLTALCDGILFTGGQDVGACPQRDTLEKLVFEAASHEVTLSGSLQALLGKDTLAVNTLHHQAVKQLAPGLTPMAIFRAFVDACRH